MQYVCQFLAMKNEDPSAKEIATDFIQSEFYCCYFDDFKVKFCSIGLSEMQVWTEAGD